MKNLIPYNDNSGATSVRRYYAGIEDDDEDDDETEKEIRGKLSYTRNRGIDD